jgi:hypothetical protein
MRPEAIGPERNQGQSETPVEPAAKQARSTSPSI